MSPSVSNFCCQCRLNSKPALMANDGATLSAIDWAQHRWLCPAEICEILSNYERFLIAPEPPNMPSSGSLFLFDNGHNWRKKKDGKTVKEAHERLKSRSIDVLHCYYAHGEEKENFQRRIYWMLEEEYSHIVLVHYREVKGNRTHFGCSKQADDVIQKSQDTKENSLNSGIRNSQFSSLGTDGRWMVPQNTDTTSHNSGQACEYEDADSAYSYQARTGYCSSMEFQWHDMPEPVLSMPYNPVPYSTNNPLCVLPLLALIIPTILELYASLRNFLNLRVGRILFRGKARPLILIPWMSFISWEINK